jgi:ubiquinol-cytochrome c reductase cytochrome b subunit
MERLRPGVFTNNIGSVSRIDAPLFSPILSVLRAHLIYYPTPQQFYYVFGVGSLLGVMFVVQVLTGVLLAMHYVPSIDLAFDSVERIMREIPSGWLLRYLHANGSSMIFILLYAHIARGLFYQSYRTPRQ